MTEMKEKGITNRGPKKRDPACLEVLDAIAIPAGTILRQDPGKPGVFSCDVGLAGKFTVILQPGDFHSHYKRVIA